MCIRLTAPLSDFKIFWCIIQFLLITNHTVCVFPNVITSHTMCRHDSLVYSHPMFLDSTSFVCGLMSSRLIEFTEVMVVMVVSWTIDINSEFSLEINNMYVYKVKFYFVYLYIDGKCIIRSSKFNLCYY